MYKLYQLEVGNILRLIESFSTLFNILVLPQKDETNVNHLIS